MRPSFLFRRRCHLRTYPNDLFLVGDLSIRPVCILMHLFQFVSPVDNTLVLAWYPEERMEYTL